MGSAVLLDSAASNDNETLCGDDDSSKSSSGMGNKKGRGKAAASNPKKESKSKPREKKRNAPQQSEEQPAGSRKMPRRAAACIDFKEKSVKLDEKFSMIEKKKDKLAEEEVHAIGLTSEGEEDRPNRRLTDFVLHDANGIPQPFEMSEVDDLFITGLILPLEDCADKEKDKEKGVRCEGFGRIEQWAISGYEDGCPIIWLSTDIADYDCLKPAGAYKKYYDHFFEKARACVEVYRKLSISSGGSPSCSLDELLAGVIRAMSGSKHFSSGASIKDFVISQGEFIFNQLIGLDDASKKNEKMFAEMPVLAALRDESWSYGNFMQTKPVVSGKGIVIGSKPVEGGLDNQSAPEVEEDEDAKLARLLQEEEYWQSMKQKKSQNLAPASTKFYIKINEDEIANDYPLPAYYKPDSEEADEFVVFDSTSDVVDADYLPRSMLHNWALYDLDSRLISLELLPMKPCDDIDVTIFGSGIMTDDDGSGFHIGSNSNLSSSSGSGKKVDGMPVYLSAIKEWMIEYGYEMIFISIRTDMAWYRLGEPSKQYAPWHQTVLRTAQLGISIINLLTEQTRVSKLSFADVIKKVSEFEKTHKSYISNNPAAVERYVVVHGQIILQLFAEYPDHKLRKCSFIVGLTKKMEERHHTKWIMKKKKIVLKGLPNLNPRANMGPIAPKRKAMQATTTRLINRIWGEYYSNYSPEDMKEETATEAKEEDEEEEQEDNEEDEGEETLVIPDETQKTCSVPRQTKARSKEKDIKWDGDSVGKTCSGEALYKQAFVHGELIAVGGAVSLEVEESDEFSVIYFVEYMFETSKGMKMFHGRMMARGSQTVLGNAANEREVFLSNECLNIPLEDVKQTVLVHIRSRPWGHQYRKSDAQADAIDRAKAEERKSKGLSPEFYCKSLYWPERGAFFRLPFDTMGLGSGFCCSCKTREAEEAKETFKLNSSQTGFFYNGTEYSIHDFVYITPSCFDMGGRIDAETFKSGRNVGLKAFVVCQLLEITVLGASKMNDARSTQIKARRFYRPEDISTEKAYCSDVREVYYSEETHTLLVEEIEGKCEVRRKNDIPPCNSPAMFQHIFYCEHLYDPLKGSIKQLPAQIKLKYSINADNDATSRKRKGKCKEGEDNLDQEKPREISKESRLVTLDIFAGCGGLSEGLQKAGASITKWAIEYEEPAADAFKLNHPETSMFVNNCNVILRAIMQKRGDIDDCISTAEAAELAASLNEKDISSLPLPGEVDFINGGPPCQGFSGMNRFNQSTWSKVQCEMILAFLSFAEYFRPKYFLLENVRNFVSFNKGQTFRLTLASLLEMGYQVRFGILEAGAYGVSQSRKRAFIWAASPEVTLPEWPEPMHVFSVPQLKISLSQNLHYAAVKSTAGGAPFRAITVRDTIGDLPPVGNGASRPNLEYQSDPISWFQKKTRADMMVLTDHVSKEMNELNLIRCQRIPKRPGADWRDLPEEKVKLSTGQVVDLIPWCLPNTAKRHNQWKGLFGRLDWEGNFPTSITDPQPMGKVGMCFHPEQDRILTVRECARSQGFPDSYRFDGNIHSKHRQIGNAVPPPLAYALGRKLKEAMDSKKAT